MVHATSAEVTGARISQPERASEAGRAIAKDKATMIRVCERRLCVNTIAPPGSTPPGSHASDA
jgi:hypothetical protein